MSLLTVDPELKLAGDGRVALERLLGAEVRKDVPKPAIVKPNTLRLPGTD